MCTEPGVLRRELQTSQSATRKNERKTHELTLSICNQNYATHTPYIILETTASSSNVCSMSGTEPLIFRFDVKIQESASQRVMSEVKNSVRRIKIKLGVVRDVNLFNENKQPSRNCESFDHFLTSLSFTSNLFYETTCSRNFTKLYKVSKQ